MSRSESQIARLDARRLQRASDNLDGARDILKAHASPLLLCEQASISFDEPEIDEDAWAEPGTEAIVSEVTVNFYVDADCSPSHVIKDAVHALRAIADRLERSLKNPMAQSKAPEGAKAIA